MLLVAAALRDRGLPTWVHSTAVAVGGGMLILLVSGLVLFTRFLAGIGPSN